MEERYCDVSDKSPKFKSIYKHLHSLTHNEFERSVKTKTAITNPDCFDIDSICNDYVTTHIENFDLNHIKFALELVFNNEFYPKFKFELRINHSKFHLQ